MNYARKRRQLAYRLQNSMPPTHSVGSDESEGIRARKDDVVLVLSRRVGEKIVIGDITLLVKRIAGQRAVLGIEAPAHMPIVRSELARRTPEQAAELNGSAVRSTKPR